jgi:hypothetical protein
MESKINQELIQKVVENQNEKILTKIPPMSAPPQVPSSQTIKPTAKAAAPSPSNNEKKMM